ncbi:hypothetical protein ASJ30_03810 [Janibacter indicus]|uniref:Rieske domain-containing protein n=1 Tax=Janibacter indicus TaxID=857417 RepID=A0A1L3MF05_9MICO|nr:Rieske 2Fe-2S domain-containing protein [Janibacter indicus]APH00766.1 hypothetical protein ASJ30_03810 [Janibacter indicus]
MAPVTGPWLRICRVEDLDRAHPLAVEVTTPDGSTARVCVALTPDGTPSVLLDRCPHRDIALSGGIVRDGELVCPGHFWRFDTRSGARTDAPTAGATVHPSRVVDAWVEARVPDPPAPAPMREWLLARAREQP